MQRASAFKEREKFVLALAPEGTRHKKDSWKSGFYHIAVDAHVPILLTLSITKIKPAEQVL